MNSTALAPTTELLNVFPDDWDGLYELDKPLHWDAFLKSELLARERYARLTYEITGRSLASISLIASTCIIVHIIRSHHGLSSTYHRLVLGLSVGDICSSIALVLNSTMVPVEMNYVTQGAQGNLFTCNFQGFLLITGMVMSVYYNCSMCFHYLAIIKYNKSNDYIRKKLEPWFHVVPILLSLVVASAILGTNGFNTWGSFCFAIPYIPPHCIGYEIGHVVDGFSIPCEKGNYYFESILYPITLSVVFIPPPLIIATTMTMMFQAVGKVKRRVERYGARSLRLNFSQRREGRHAHELDENDTDQETSRLKNFTLNVWKFLMCHRDDGYNNILRSRLNTSGQSQKRAVLYMAAGYASAWALVYIPATIIYIIGISTFSTRLVNTILIPLQGLYDFIVFMSPKVRSAKKSKRGQPKISWSKAIIKAFISRGERRSQNSLISSRNLHTGRSSLNSSVQRLASSLRQALRGSMRGDHHHRHAHGAVEVTQQDPTLFEDNKQTAVQVDTPKVGVHFSNGV